MSGRRSAGSVLARYLPGVGWLGGYRGPWLRGDLVAGVTTAAVVIPQAMAYATIAGLPVQAGLYVATVPMLVYALAGTSRPLSVSTTSTLAALTAAGVGSVAGGDPTRALVAASTLAALMGVLLLGAGILRLGFTADFISAPVLTGFKARHRAADRRRPARQDPRRPPGGRRLLHQGRLGSGPPGRDQLANLRPGPGQHRHPAWAAPLAPPSLPGPLLVVLLGIVLAVTTGLADRGVALVGTIPPACPTWPCPTSTWSAGWWRRRPASP